MRGQSCAAGKVVKPRHLPVGGPFVKRALSGAEPRLRVLDAGWKNACWHELKLPPRA